MGMGGTLAKYAAEGVETHLICASRGERGWFGPEEQNPGLERLGQIRTRELENAVAALGLKSLHFLDYIDGDVDKAPVDEIVKKIATHIRLIKPQVIVTFPPDGGYGHPDHIAIGQFTQASILCAADQSYVTVGEEAAHRVSKLYYMVDAESFIDMIAPFVGDMTFPVDDQIRGEIPWKEWMITTRVSMEEHCQTAWKAIQCHKSQLATLGPMAEMHSDAASAILAMQGAFYRVFSLVNGGRTIETDLFEGIR
jgi:LmbE family N-acetylglucosaminyl deacetylase